MSLKKLSLAALLMFALCACNNDQPINAYIPDEGEIQLDVCYPGASRVSDAAFEAQDQIGVYVTQSEYLLQLAGNVVNNEQFTFDGTAWIPQNKVYWNTGNHNIYAYYPYSQFVDDVENFSFAVSTDQSVTENYYKSDFLWASALNVAATNNPVKLQFEHKFSKVVVKLVKGEQFEGEIPDNAEVYIHSTVAKAVVDLSTGDAAKDSYAGTETIRCRKVSTDEYAAIVVPQSLTSKRPLVEVIIGKVSYLMDGKVSFHQGYMHTLTVTLNQNPEQVKIEIGGGITGWE